MNLNIRTLLNEPLLQFAVAGVLLFGAHQLFVRSQVTEGSQTEKVVIGEGEIRWLKETFNQQQKRLPSSAELRDLVANLLEEELLAREARSLGLDQSDTIVRRRLAQKMTFLVEDTAQIVDPTEQQLRNFYHSRLDSFSENPKVSFEHIYFSTDRRRNAEADAQTVLNSLRKNDAVDLENLGDPLLIANKFDSLNQQSISSAFGEEFARAVFQLSPNIWSGPIRSGFGFHLVQVTSAEPMRVRSFEMVRSRVLQEWRLQQQLDLKAAYLAKLKDKYGIEFEASAETFSSVASGDAGK